MLRQIAYCDWLAKAAIYFCLGAFTYSVQALDEKRLWLPVSYQSLYLKLKEAALKAESLERCVTILDGTIDLEQSKQDYPIFRINCRQASGSTYNEMVDGVSIETLTTPIIIELPPTEEELLKLRIEEERRQQEELIARKQTFWGECEKLFQQRTRLMLNPVRLEEGMPEPDPYDDDIAVYTIDFDAESLSGEKLEFRARCIVQWQVDITMKLAKRPVNVVNE